MVAETQRIGGREERGEHEEKVQGQEEPGGAIIFKLVGISFGLLCIIQSAVNVYIWLQAVKELCRPLQCNPLPVPPVMPVPPMPPVPPVMPVPPMPPVPPVMPVSPLPPVPPMMPFPPMPPVPPMMPFPPMPPVPPMMPFPQCRLSHQ
ncbi:homeobox protein ESX1-like [Oreochromis aureus]|uniref:homeobox protein ESX1-like n=1 Tax=Oreochromis aureus TaxID=47969 RepID=UPI001953791F|nr:homeobox protein ESX1-like [Oreochromis aureus]